MVNLNKRDLYFFINVSFNRKKIPFDNESNISCQLKKILTNFILRDFTNLLYIYVHCTLTGYIHQLSKLHIILE